MIVFIIFIIAFFVLFMVATNLWNGEWLIEGRLHIFSLFWIAKGQIVVIEFRLDVKLIKLVIHGVVGLFDDWDKMDEYRRGMDFWSFSFWFTVLSFVSWVPWTELNKIITSIVSVLSASLSFFMSISYKIIFKIHYHIF